MKTVEPEYITIYRLGELEKRVHRLEARLVECNICPRECGANRLKGKVGSCNCGMLPIVSSFCAHHGEEPVLSSQPFGYENRTDKAHYKDFRNFNKRK